MINLDKFEFEKFKNGHFNQIWTIFGAKVKLSLYGRILLILRSNSVEFSQVQSSSVKFSQIQFYLLNSTKFGIRITSNEI